MTLELSDTQARALQRALSEYLETMEFELARTEQREARTQLRAIWDLLEEIKRRVQAGYEGGEAYV